MKNACEFLSHVVSCINKKSSKKKIHHGVTQSFTEEEREKGIGCQDFILKLHETPCTPWLFFLTAYLVDFFKNLVFSLNPAFKSIKFNLCRLFWLKMKGYVHR